MQEEHSLISRLHGLVAEYKMPERGKSLIGLGEVVVLCGVTAAGKNTIANLLIQKGNYEHVVSHTTRAPRENHGILEQNGKEYWFVNNEQMMSMVTNHKFVEVKSIHGQQISGTSIEEIENIINSGKHPVMEIEVQGVLELTNTMPSLRPLFVLPPSYEVWMNRLGSRGNISDGEKQRRLRSASMEIQTALDHPAFILTVNHEVELTVAEIMSGVDTTQSTQLEHRKLAQELIEAVRHI